MSKLLFSLILLLGTAIYSFDMPQNYECEAIQLDSNLVSQPETSNCCSDFCFCNCCNHVSLLSLIMTQNNYENYSKSISLHSIKDLSDYSTLHWQPPKV